MNDVGQYFGDQLISIYVCTCCNVIEQPDDFYAGTADGPVINTLYSVASLSTMSHFEDTAPLVVQPRSLAAFQVMQSESQIAGQLSSPLGCKVKSMPPPLMLVESPANVPSIQGWPASFKQNDTFTPPPHRRGKALLRECSPLIRENVESDPLYGETPVVQVDGGQWPPLFLDKDPQHAPQAQGGLLLSSASLTHINLLVRHKCPSASLQRVSVVPSPSEDALLEAAPLSVVSEDLLMGSDGICCSTTVTSPFTEGIGFPRKSSSIRPSSLSTPCHDVRNVTTGCWSCFSGCFAAIRQQRFAAQTARRADAAFQ